MCQIVYRLNFSSSIVSLAVESQDDRIVVLFTTTSPSRFNYSGRDSPRMSFHKETTKSINRDKLSLKSLLLLLLPFQVGSHSKYFSSSAFTNSFAVLTSVGIYTGPLRLQI